MYDKKTFTKTYPMTNKTLEINKYILDVHRKQCDHLSQLYNATLWDLMIFIAHLAMWILIRTSNIHDINHNVFIALIAMSSIVSIIMWVYIRNKIILAHVRFQWNADQYESYEHFVSALSSAYNKNCEAMCKDLWFSGKLKNTMIAITLVEVILLNVVLIANI